MGSPFNGIEDGEIAEEKREYVDKNDGWDGSGRNNHLCKN
jgi:hypothetical protein